MQGAALQCKRQHCKARDSTTKQGIALTGVLLQKHGRVSRRQAAKSIFVGLLGGFLFSLFEGKEVHNGAHLVSGISSKFVNKSFRF